MEDKAQIRKRMLAARDAIPADRRKAACGYVCDKLLSIPGVPRSKTGVYFPIKSEIDIKQAINGILSSNNRVFLPIITKPEKILEFHEWDGISPLEKGAFGVPEPRGGEVVVPDVIWVPLVAFDRKGYRIGYGGGYYDATIAHLKKSNPALRTIGIGYSLQEIEAFAHVSHDMKLDMIVTEKEIITV